MPAATQAYRAYAPRPFKREERGEVEILFGGLLVGGKVVKEVVAVAAAVEKLHPAVSFVSEIGGEHMKTIFFTPSGPGRNKQVYMQSACSGGTGTFIEKAARKLKVSPEALAQMTYEGRALHKISSKCAIFDQPTLTPVQKIVEGSGTLFFSFQDLDATKPAGSVKIRVETIAYYPERSSAGIIASKKQRIKGSGPLARSGQSAHAGEVIQPATA